MRYFAATIFFALIAVSAIAEDATPEPQQLSETITVTATTSKTPTVTTALKTETPLRDTPQAVTVVSREIIAEQSMQGMADVVRYVPGIQMAQGEGNRDTPIFRGNSSTGDFYVDGVRDDAQYFRDTYNVERVEALKGPNAMVFGRGGIGGVINRVSRQADFSTAREISLQSGSFNNRRVTADFGGALSGTIAARVTGLFEDSGSYRSDVSLARRGINPTFAFALGSNTLLRAGYEYFHDGRTADRGVSSYAGRPVETDPAQFWGNADLSEARADVHSLFTSVDHTFTPTVSMRSRIALTDYDKFYQNVYPGAVDGTGKMVSIAAYNNDTQRQNIFSQTDLVVTRVTGNVLHTIVSGVEIGRQTTDNFRETGYFTSVGTNVTSVFVPIVSPTTTLPVTFRQSATDADNRSIARVGSVYVQDQIAFGTHVQVIAGLRYDSFNVDLHNNRTSADLASNDGLVSPRFGLVLKPTEATSLYASYSVSYQPRAGDQLASLTATNAALDPETFRNLEAGFKWDVLPALQLSTAIYRLDRGNVIAPDPVNPALSTLVDGQRTQGLEVSVSGDVTSRWSVISGYALQRGEILESLSATARAGAELAQVPRHSLSIWNRYELTRKYGVGLGVIHRSSVFTSTDNTVTLPAFTRIDAGFFAMLTNHIHAQVNIENVMNTRYYASAHSNTNITPGSPRAVRIGFTTRF